MTPSFSLSPQARDDSGVADAGASVILDVMQNDLGGAAKRLHGVAAAAVSDLVAARTEGVSRLGASVKIVDGRILYDMQGSSAIAALGAGETAVDTFVYAIRLANGTLSTAQVSVTVTGSNDAPVVTAQDLNASVQEAATPLGLLGDNGTIAFSDADLRDAHTVGPVTASAGALGNLRVDLLADSTGTGSGGTLAWEYGVDAALLEPLAAGELRTESFTFTLSDGQGGAFERTVDVSLAGTNDAPVAAPDSNSVDPVVEAGLTAGDAQARGNVLANDTDVDRGAVLSLASVNGASASVGATVRGMYGDIVIGADGSYSYTLDNDRPATNALAGGQQASDVFSYAVIDEFGASSTSTLKIDITGSDEKPVTGPSLIDFEDITTYGALADGYRGFNWDVPFDLNLYAAPSRTWSAGYAVGTRGEWAAYSAFGYEPVNIYRPDGSDFTFASVNATSAWQMYQAVRFTGYNDGQVVGSVNVTLTMTRPTLVAVNWAPIDRLVIDATGSVNQHLSQMVFDNFMMG